MKILILVFFVIGLFISGEPPSSDEKLMALTFFVMGLFFLLGFVALRWEIYEFFWEDLFVKVWSSAISAMKGELKKNSVFKMWRLPFQIIILIMIVLGFIAYGFFLVLCVVIPLLIAYNLYVNQ